MAKRIYEIASNPTQDRAVDYSKRLNIKELNKAVNVISLVEFNFTGEITGREALFPFQQYFFKSTPNGKPLSLERVSDIVNECPASLVAQSLNRNNPDRKSHIRPTVSYLWLVLTNYVMHGDAVQGGEQRALRLPRTAIENQLGVAASKFSIKGCEFIVTRTTANGAYTVMYTGAKVTPPEVEFSCFDLFPYDVNSPFAAQQSALRTLKEVGMWTSELDEQFVPFAPELDEQGEDDAE